MTNLERIRRDRGFSQEDVAHAAQVPQTTVSRAENGKGITFKSAMRIVRALGLTVEEVFGDVDVDDGPDVDTLRTDATEASTEIVRPSHPAVA